MYCYYCIIIWTKSKRCILNRIGYFFLKHILMSEVTDIMLPEFFVNNWFNYDIFGEHFFYK